MSFGFRLNAYGIYKHKDVMSKCRRFDKVFDTCDLTGVHATENEQTRGFHLVSLLRRKHSR